MTTTTASEENHASSSASAIVQASMGRLKPGAVRQLYDSYPGTEAKLSSGEPVYLQIVHLKAFEAAAAATSSHPLSHGNGSTTNNGSSNGGFRYKIVLSDGVHFIQGNLSSGLHHLAESRTIDTFDVVRVTGYVVLEAKGHRFLSVSAVDVQDVVKIGHKVGSPTNVETAHNNDAAASPTSVSAPTTILPLPSKPALPMNSGGKSTMLPQPALNVSKYEEEQTNDGGNSRLSKAEVSELMPLVQPISSLNPYNDRYPAPLSHLFSRESSHISLHIVHCRWVIKAKVVQKTDIKKWANAKGEGKLFSCTLTDASGDIRCTAFKDACDKFFDFVRNDRVYLVSQASVKIAKRQFGGVQNDYELHLETTSLVQEVDDDAKPTVHYVFVPLSKVGTLERDAFVDVIGVVKDVGPIVNLTARTTQRPLVKRDVTLVDPSATLVTLTVWGEEWTQRDFVPSQDILAIKGAKVSDYQGRRTLGTLRSTLFVVNPPPSTVPEVSRVLDWLHSHDGRDLSGVPLSTIDSLSTNMPGSGGERKPLSAIKTERLGLQSAEKSDYVTVTAFLSYLNANNAMSYAACPTPGCAKKVAEYGPSMWRCERCAREFDSCQHRYTFNPSSHPACILVPQPCM
jgi:replication factor A1